MASKTGVVLTTVGPYLKYGEPLVEACALQETDYCDLTGEVPFIQSMIDKYQDSAEESGARLVNCAGFDSLPSDLGVLYLNEYALNTYDSSLKTVEMQVRAAQGGVSGGTIASAVETVTLLRKEPDLAKVLQNPYAACPTDKRSGIRQPSLIGAKRSEFTGDWLHQFIMASVNTKIVHATNARLDYPYGEDFRYSEWQVASNPVAAYLAEFSIGAMMLAMYFPWTRSFLTRFLLPKSGQKVTGQVTGDADPGYGSTAKQISEVALGLVRSRNADKKPGGFWTPGSCLGLQLVEPLTEHAGLTFAAE
jgi:saccharopine dehydrogenase (NAD+, L-glutamate forming)